MGSRTISYPLYGGGNLLVEIDEPEDTAIPAGSRPPIPANLDSIVAQVKPARRRPGDALHVEAGEASVGQQYL